MHPPRYMLVLAGVLSISCGGGGDITAPPTTGTLEITTSTGGTEPDADGYVVQLDSGPTEALGASATVRKTDLSPGAHTVHLSGLASNCTVASENPRAVNIIVGETATVSFAITCNATTGSLQVSASTGGSSPDADGYSVTLDGADRGTIGASGSITLEALAPGSHVVGLAGVAVNCQVQGNNLRAVTVTAGASATVTFAVTCATPPPGAGTLRVTTTTTGPDQDGDGYTLAVDGGTAQVVGVNAVASLANLSAGTHTVQLSGNAGNCNIQGMNPRTVTVSSGTTADVGFAVSCTATTGTVQVSVVTSGSPTDPNGYVVKLDGGEPGRPIAATASVTLPDVPAGSHTVLLTDVATNCAVAEGPSRTVSVTAGGSVQVGFTVTCSPTAGTLQISTATTGSSPDIDGYLVAVDGGSSQVIKVSQTLTLSGAAPGSHNVLLSGVASNCSVSSANPSSINIVAGATATVTFAVACPPPAVTRWRQVLGPSFGDDLLSISGTSSNSVFAVGAPSAIAHFDGANWGWQPSPLRALAVWANSPMDAFAVAPSGGVRANILRYNGQGWSEMDTPIEGQEGETEVVPFDIWGSGNEVFVVGHIYHGGDENDYITRFNGIVWTRMTDMPTGPFYSHVWGSAANDVYVSGTQVPGGHDSDPYEHEGFIIHYDGSQWTTAVKDQSVRLGSMWGSSPNNVYAAGRAVDATGTVVTGAALWHFDGTRWSPTESPTNEPLRSIWGTAADDVFLLASDGTIWRFNGARWSLSHTSGVPMSDIWVSPSGDVFVVGKDGTILHGTR